MADFTNKKVKQSGTGFTNIQRVLGANTGNRLGSTLQGGVQSTIGQGQQTLGSAKSAFEEQAQKGAVGSEQDKQKVQTTIQGAGQDGEPKQEDLSAFERFRQGYQGPQQLNDSNLLAQTQDAQSLARATGSVGGRTGLLQRYVGKPSYTQGQKRLDTALLGQSGADALRSSKRSALDLVRNSSVAQQQAYLEGQRRSDEANQFNQYIKNQLGGAETSLMGDVETRRGQYETEAKTAQDVLRQILNPTKREAPKATPGEVTTMPVGSEYIMPSLSQEQVDQTTRALQRAGISDGLSYINPYAAPDFNLATVLGDDPINVSREQAMTDQDKARYLALRQLGAQDPGQITKQTQVGGKVGLPFDVENYNKVNKNILDNIYNPAQEQLRGSQNRMSELKDVQSAMDVNSKQGLIEQELNRNKQALEQFEKNPNIQVERRDEYESLLNQQKDINSRINQSRNDYQQLVAKNPHLANLENYRNALHLESNFNMNDKIGDTQRDIDTQQKVLDRYGKPSSIFEKIRSLVR